MGFKVGEKGQHGKNGLTQTSNMKHIRT